MEQKPETNIKAHDFRTGFFSWYLLGNLGVVAYLILYPILVHPAFPLNLKLTDPFPAVELKKVIKGAMETKK
ncbi:MAG TPA: hypothetical protein VGJ22_14385 [Anaerolineales bacterium]|jgi:hypothetical protein